MLKTLNLITEAVSFVACLVIGFKWANEPDNALYEPWFVLCALVFIASEILRKYEIHLIKREGLDFSPEDLEKHSEALRKKFKEEIAKCRENKLRRDVIIRHVSKLDAYPKGDNSKGISPWFRAGLLDTYQKGIMAALSFGTLTKDKNGYRYTNYNDSEKGDIKVYLVGTIPFEYIEDVNFDGDEYYSFPQIYCHFANKGEPFENLAYYQEVETENGDYNYNEIAPYEDVEINSKQIKGSYFS